MKKVILISSIYILAQGSENEIFQAISNGEVSGNLRSIYINREYDLGSSVNKFGFGGSLKYESAPFNDIRVGVGFYSEHNFGFKDEYTQKADLVGEAYLEYKSDLIALKLGRQSLATPLIAPDYVGMMPNLFEAYKLELTPIEELTLRAIYISKMMGLDKWAGDTREFEYMSEVSHLGEKGLNSGVIALNASYSGIFDANIWGYDMENLFKVLYFDISDSYEINKLSLAIAGQYYNYFDSKDELVDYSVAGAKGSVKYEGVTLSSAYNIVDGDRESQTLFGSWGGYPEYAWTNIAWADSLGAPNSEIVTLDMLKFRLDFDLSQYSLGDRNIGAQVVKYYFSNTLYDATVYDIDYSCNPFDKLTLYGIYQNVDSEVAQEEVLKFTLNYPF